MDYLASFILKPKPFILHPAFFPLKIFSYHFIDKVAVELVLSRSFFLPIFIITTTLCSINTGVHILEVPATSFSEHTYKYAST